MLGIQTECANKRIIIKTNSPERPIYLLQLTVPLPVKTEGVRGLLTDTASVDRGEQPPPDLSEYGLMVSSPT